jgi:hypothetical protein
MKIVDESVLEVGDIILTTTNYHGAKGIRALT